MKQIMMQLTKNQASKLVATLAAALIAGGLLAGPAEAKPEKVRICHVDEDQRLIPIRVAKPALDAHLGHGDLLVGIDVDENCQPLDLDGDGVPDDIDNCANVANPAQTNRYGSADGDACEDLDGDGTPDVHEAEFCLSVSGTLAEVRGTPTCSTDPGSGNVAVANGFGAFAVVSGTNSTGTAIGFTAQVFVSGTNSVGIADGVGAVAQVILGTGNTAIATGDNTRALAVGGSNNSATATVNYACAGNGDSNETALDENLC